MARNQTYDELKQRVKVLEKEAGNRKRAEETLRESEERYRLFSDNVTDVIWIRDMNLRFTYISPSVTKMTGYSVEEAMAFSLEDVYTPASIEVIRNALAEELTIEKIGNADPFRVRTLELEGFCKDGSMIWTEAKMSFLRDPAGQVVGIFGVSRDITQRRQVEEALRESEKRYRSILETAPHSITITRVKDGRYLQVNEAFCQIRGYSREEVLGRTPFELKLYVNPEDRESLINILKEKGEVNGFEVQYQKRDGTAIDTLFSARPLEYENEDCLIAVVTDITELKQAEEALKKRLAYEKMLADISTLAILIEDISRCLDECLEIMGKTLHISRIYIFEYHHGPGTADNTFEWVSDGIAPQKENLQGLPMKKYPWWMEMMNNNKIINYKDIEDIPGGPEKEILRSQNIKSILIVPLFVNNAFYGFMGFDECRYHRKWLNEDVDILKSTAQIISNAFESKQAEEALRESEKKYRDLVENISDVIYSIDTDGVVTYISPAIESILDYSPSEIIGKSFIEFVYKEDLTRMRKRFEETLSGHIKPSEYRVLSKSGEIHWILASSKQVFIENHVIGIQGVVTDITERKQAEVSLQKSEEQYRLLADNVIDVISRHSLDGTILYVSPSASALLGYEPMKLIGTNGFDPIIPQDDLPKIQSRIISLLNQEHSSAHLEHRMIKKNGNHVWVETTSRLRQNTDSDQSFEVISVTREITERKQATLALQEKEQKLERQAQHLEEVNTALKVLLEHREEEKKKSEENILSNVQKLIFPYIEKLENSHLDNKNKTYVDIIRSNLKELISPFGNTLSSKYTILTSTEIQVADLIKHGRTSKEIASLLNVSIKAISFHRGNIRKKLGLVNKKINLRSQLQSLAT